MASPCRARAHIISSQPASRTTLAKSTAIGPKAMRNSTDNNQDQHPGERQAFHWPMLLFEFDLVVPSVVPRVPDTAPAKAVNLAFDAGAKSMSERGPLSGKEAASVELQNTGGSRMRPVAKYMARSGANHRNQIKAASRTATITPIDAWSGGTRSRHHCDLLGIYSPSAASATKGALEQRSI
jgi:hypothetical protein